MKDIISISLLLLLIVSCADTSNESKSTKPNIILIMADDQGWGDLSHSGNTNVATPHIDALASNGISFENFFVQPVCSPTRAELLTGRYYPSVGVYSTSAGGERMNLHETTLADILKKAGYATAAYGKWHNGMQPPYHPNSRGFDDFYGFASGHWGNYFSPMLEHNGTIVSGNGYLTDDLTSRGIEFISNNKDNPFFLYLPFNTPHSPMQVPDKYWKKFKDHTIEKRYQGDDQEPLEFTKAALAMVENIDYNVGRVTSHLQNLDLLDNTIVIYLSDNGPNSYRFNGGLKGRKGSTDEGGVKTAFFIQFPNKLAKGKKIEQIASALDILPTVCELADVPAETLKPIDGKSLSPLLLKDNPPWEDRLIYNHWNKNTSVRSQKYRLDKDNNLYNMESDRGQKVNISAQFPVIADSLEKAKTKWETTVFLLQENSRPFTLGDPESEFTHLPARDGIPHGDIKRSNKYPNDSYFTNWKQSQDSITWDVEVIEDGEFQIDLYYTCGAQNLGSTIQLSYGENTVTNKVNKAHDPPLLGMENDRVVRSESYVKNFASMQLGTIILAKGKGKLVLKALKVPGTEVMDLRLLVFKRKV